jgi:hypothetical protein
MHAKMQSTFIRVSAILPVRNAETDMHNCRAAFNQGMEAVFAMVQITLPRYLRRREAPEQ